MSDAGSSISRRWRILLVDDCADDAELAQIALRQGGIDAEYQRVEREATLRAALDAFEPDLVLSDVNLPGFSGVEARALVEAHAPTTRFVFLTGALRNDAPLPAADGVLLKDEMARLPDLVRLLLG